MTLRIMVSRHSAFYSPLIATLAAGFLERRGLAGEYSTLGAGQRSSDLFRDGTVDIMQSAVSSNWGAMERGESKLPVHVAQINCRDGFFLVARHPDPTFQWGKLAGQTVLADHGLQPLVMLKYAARSNGVDWTAIDAVDAGSPEKMAQSFREGTGEYVHLQSPDAHRLEVEGSGYVVASVGASMPTVAFSSICCSRRFAQTGAFRDFLEAFREARNWVRSASPAEVARAEASFFPGYPEEALTAAVTAYQKLGCWEGETEIPRALYEQAVHVFQTEGAISRPYAYQDVCA